MGTTVAVNAHCYYRANYSEISTVVPKPPLLTLVKSPFNEFSSC